MTDIQRLEAKVDRLLEAIPAREYITVKDISLMYGWSLSFINRNPWTMPNWGKSDFPGHERRWLTETAEEWYRVPPARRQMAWNQTSIRQRQKLTA